MKCSLQYCGKHFASRCITVQHKNKLGSECTECVAICCYNIRGGRPGQSGLDRRAKYHYLDQTVLFKLQQNLR